MIKIGTCGFSFKDWKGTVYPQKIKDRDILPYYNQELGFDIVEIDASYYRIPTIQVSSSWVEKTTPDFLFAVKCHRDMTLNEMKNNDPSRINNQAIFSEFLRNLQPIIQSGKLLTFLAQFGPVFYKNSRTIEYLKRFRTEFKELPLTVEFRHKSWLTEEQREHTFDILRKMNLGYAVVDEPRIRSLAPWIPEATTSLAYVRLHGRNTKWFEGDAGTRYDYFYSDEELTEFIPFIKELEFKTTITTVFFNNCHAGAALKNAVKLRQLLNIATRNVNMYQEDGKLENQMFPNNITDKPGEIEKNPTTNSRTGKKGKSRGNQMDLPLG